jgi:hypothetical protein
LGRWRLNLKETRMPIVLPHRYRIGLAIAALAAAMLTGCAAQSPQTPPAHTAEPPAAQAPATPSTETPPPSPASVPATPAPKTATPAAPAPAPVDRKNDSADRLADKPPGIGADNADPNKPDRRCKTDSDCTVKDVGNCCGYFPMCLNKNAKTDPAAVRAQCEKSGMASICGFREIKGCQCVQGRCENSADGAVAM